MTPAIVLEVCHSARRTGSSAADVEKPVIVSTSATQRTAAMYSMGVSSRYTRGEARCESWSTTLIVVAVLLTSLLRANAVRPPHLRRFRGDLQDRPGVEHRESPERTAVLQEHSANLAKLRAAGTIVMGARYADIGLVVVTAATEAEAKKLFDADPSIAAGTFALDIQRFSVFYPGYVGTPPK